MFVLKSDLGMYVCFDIRFGSSVKYYIYGSTHYVPRKYNTVILKMCSGDSKVVLKIFVEIEMNVYKKIQAF